MTSTGDKPLVGQITNAQDVRTQASAIKAKAEQIARTLGAPCATPQARTQAKDQLVKLSKDALALWRLI